MMSEFDIFCVDLVIPILSILFISLFVIIIKTRADHLGLLLSFKKSTIIIFISILFLFSFIWSVSPHFHSMWLDETYYVSSARGMLEGGSANHVKESGFTFSKYNFGWSYMIFILFLIFGINLNLAFIATLIVSLLSLFLVFLISKLLFKSDLVSILAVLFLSISRIFLVWSMHAETNLPGLLFALLLLYFTLMFCFSKKQFYLHGIVISFFISMSCRVEHLFLILPLSILIGYHFLKQYKLYSKREKKQKMLKSLFLAGILFLFLFLSLSVPQLRSQVQERNAPGMYSFDSMISNLSFQTPRFFNEFIPPGIFIMGIIGWFLAFRRNKIIHLTLFIWFIIYYLFWPSRIIDWNQPRYYLIIIWIITIYAAHFISVLYHKLHKMNTRKIIGFSLLALILILWIPYVGRMYDALAIPYKYSDSNSEADIDFTKMWIDSVDIPSDMQYSLEKNGELDPLIIALDEDALFLYSGSELNVYAMYIYSDIEEVLSLFPDSNLFYYEGMLSRYGIYSTPDKESFMQNLKSYNLTLYQSFKLGGQTADLYKLN